MTELLKAAKYYKNRAPGWLVLVNGQPFHFFGKTGKKEALAFIKKQ